MISSDRDETTTLAAKVGTFLLSSIAKVILIIWANIFTCLLVFVNQQNVYFHLFTFSHNGVVDIGSPSEGN